MAKHKKALHRKKTKKVSARTDRVYYTLNPEFEFFEELKNLILKSSPAEKDKMIKRISGLGRVKLAIASGVFLNGRGSNDTVGSEVDLFIVGDDIRRSRLNYLLKSL